MPSSQTALITGASGLLGRHLLEVLPADWSVVAVCRRPPVPEPDLPHVTWVSQDLTDAVATLELMESVRPELVVHLAGDVRGARGEELVHPTLASNLLATLSVLQASLRCGAAKVISTGSLLEEPMSSGPAPVPPSPYGASRWAASCYGRMFHALYGLPLVLLRPSMVYGPGQSRDKLVPYVTSELIAGRDPKLSDGARLVDWVYARDVAEAYLAAARMPGIEGQTIDIGSGTMTSVTEIVDRIRTLVPANGAEPRYGEVMTRPLEQHVEVDVDVPADLLGWRAATSLLDGLRLTVDSIRR